jgi:6-phosphogluconolactonase
MEKFLEVLPDKEQLVERALTLVADKIQAVIEQKGECAIALSGGSTPKPLYQALARLSLPWDKILVFWGDERYVSPDSDESNQKMARQAWLNLVPIPRDNIHPMPTAANDPEIDARAYETEIKNLFKVFDNNLPVFDIVLLGMGGDGHTASLFPHTEVLTYRDRLVAVGNKDGQPRLTFTVPLINAANCVVFLVAGADKQVALKQILATEGDWQTYPARLIQPQGELWWLLDRSAGEHLVV